MSDTEQQAEKPTLSQEISNRLVQHDSRDEFERGLLRKARKAGQMLVSAADEVLSWNTNALPWEVIGRVGNKFDKAMVALHEIGESIRNGEQETDEPDDVATECSNNGCQCSRIREDVTAYLLHRLNGEKETFNEEFMPVIELLTSGTAPLMTLMEAKNLHGLKPENDMSAIEMAALVLIELRTHLQIVIEDATCHAIETEENTLAVVGNEEE